MSTETPETANSVAQDLEEAFAELGEDDVPDQDGALDDDAPAEAPDDDDQPAETPDDDQPAEAPADSEEAPPAEETAPDDDEIPLDWPADEHEALSRADPEIRRLVLKKARDFQRDYTRKTEALARERKQYESLTEIFEERRDFLAQAGFKPVEAVQALFQLNDYAQRDAKGYAKWFLAQKGLTVEDLLDDAGAPGGLFDEPAETPPLEREVQSLKQQLEAQKYAEIHRAVEAFRTAKDEGGGLRHPYYDALKDDMAFFLRSGRATTLGDAYEMAARVNPEIARKKAAAEALAAQRKDAERRKAHAEKARRAGKSVTGAGATAGHSRQPKATIAAEMEAIADELGINL